MRAGLEIVVGIVVVMATAPGGLAQARSLEDVLRRAADYVTAYERDFKAIVGTEVYEQQVWRPARPGGPPAVQAETRRLLSELTLIWLPGDRMWMAYRDVVSVDGVPVADRAERREKFLLSAPSAGDLKRLADESTRFNIGGVQRNFNEPTLALIFLDPAFQPRFRFRKEGETSIDGAAVWKVTFKERRRPTFIRSPERDLFAEGALWIEPETGRVRRTEIHVDDEDSHISCEMSVDYREDSRLGLWVPAAMRERYVHARGGGEEIRGVATYTNFRRFEVDARIR
jgi:hypothetical protein